MATERKMKLDRQDWVDIYDLLDGNSIEETSLKLSALADKYAPEVMGKGYTVEFNINHYYDDFSVTLDVYRPETDDEVAKREAKAKRARETAKKKREAEKEKAREKLYKQEADERAEYERLREKYGVKQ